MEILSEVGSAFSPRASSPDETCSLNESPDEEFSMFGQWLTRIRSEDSSDEYHVQNDSDDEEPKEPKDDDHDTGHHQSSCFDEDGFPRVESVVPIVCPRPRARKEQTLASRKSQTTEGSLSTKKTEGPLSTPRAKRPCTPSKASPDGVLTQIRISGPTREANPRTQVTATCGANSRVHVFSLNKN